MEVTKEIEVMLDDFAKGIAGRQEVVKAIDDRVELQIEKEKAEQEKKLQDVKDNAESALEQLKAANEAMNKQIKTMVRLGAGSQEQWPHWYKDLAVWNTPEMARNFGLLVLAVADKQENARKILDEKGIDLKFAAGEKAMGEGTLAGGGALVMTENIPTLIALQEKYGVYRRNTQVYPMASDYAIAPKLSSSLTVYCPGEGTAITASDLAVNNVGLTAKMWATLTAISIQLDEDSAVAIGEVVGRQIAWAFAKKEDQVGFLGDGTGTYFGCTGITGALRGVDATIGNIKSLVVGAGNAYSELTLANFENVCGILPEYADDGEAKWFVSRLFYFTVMIKLALAAGGATATEIIQGRGAKEKTYLSYPVEFTQAMPKTEANSQICSLLGNLRMGSYLGDRRQVRIDRGDEVYFANAQIGIRGIQRVAVSVHGVGDTTDAGPICGLITAAS